ncbi:Na+/H+ antiporter NhaC [Levilactobacillus brevis]|uniref:Na+/H+ antiporter NhaC n=2 Tax=Levilactobacillus brevis TaxID=1580 RepID=A0A0C1PTX5_LEVBR|nr:Na+/H+ antiporter NhaC [Levilactobacillus brevis]AJA80270.1 sodium:proton antiporter [Levilactobacillus brevis BSO 464]ANN48144.1 Na+/H+ antiporter NhaC [Levilactobacillus brevis]ERK43097.1 Na+/H+ antiporter NhaC [Levilactobacillus brevis ATCC 14869 = DSM 20054]KID44172.1 putative tyrosine transporter, NhaC family [Levilactobacillus brevis]KIO96872.1 putative tyrosine transporter, NhaC family [Levilactobacillus brevis]
MKENSTKTGKPISFTEALMILLAMLVVMGLGVIKFGLSPTTPVLLVISLVILWAKVRGANWDTIHDGIIDGIKTGIIPIFIFLLIGALISVWIAAGIIPSMMVFGFHMISAQWFVPSVFLVCAIIGTSIGSAFTIISTIGIALFGMGTTMGFNPALVAGAIISGAIFGDKTSPLSDSTNLASAIAESELFAHIKNLMWSTIPAFLVSLVLYFFMGNGASDANAMGKINATLTTLNTHFSITWWAVLPILVMFACAWRKIPAIPTLLLNIGLAIVMIFIEKPTTSLSSIATMIESGFVSKTGNGSVDALLTRGGISAMMSTVSLIILTLTLGGLLMKFNVIQTVMVPLAKRLHGTGSLVTAAILAGIGVNIFVGEQYLSVILPGKAFKETFNARGLDNLALSRVLEDGGTVINYLVPWGVAAVFAANTLGVSTLAYLPFCFFSLLSPVFSILSGFTGVGLKRLPSKDDRSATAASIAANGR